MCTLQKIYTYESTCCEREHRHSKNYASCGHTFNSEADITRVLLARTCDVCTCDKNRAPSAHINKYSCARRSGVCVCAWKRSTIRPEYRNSKHAHIEYTQLCRSCACDVHARTSRQQIACVHIFDVVRVSLFRVIPRDERAARAHLVMQNANASGHARVTVCFTKYPHSLFYPLIHTHTCICIEAFLRNILLTCRATRANARKRASQGRHLHVPEA